MNQKQKEELIERTRNHIASVQEVIGKNILRAKVWVNKTIQEYKPANQADQYTFWSLKRNNQIRLDQLEILNSSPYFVKCKIKYDNEDEIKTFYFAKFQLSEESIYSWIAPASSIRFEKPGIVLHKIPNGEMKGTLISKEQYMIVDGKLIFFAFEAENVSRELIYQEHFTRQKSGFILPEIVEQMEKAQDKVIRADHKGSFVISGPAGSGKTTLALHRIAYLVQSPDTKEFYPEDTIVVFVQDNGTKDYFSHLLPELGIKNVTITTFFEWAYSILNMIPNGNNMHAFDEKILDIYEYQKLQALRNYSESKTYSANHFKVLESIYKAFLSKETHELFKYQKNKNIFDRFDLTILLDLFIKKFGKLEIKRAFNILNREDVIRKKTSKKTLKYSLIMLDEFQNYLPEQLRIFKQSFGERNDALLYIGDMNQQVQVGTISDWNEINEIIHEERKVVLEKVYRNTKSIISYIKDLGFNIEIPPEIKEGKAVVEKIGFSKNDEKVYIKNLLNSLNQGSLGILSKNRSYLEDFKDIKKAGVDIHFMTMREAQGLEFDIVCIVGIDNDFFSHTEDESFPVEFIREKKRIEKDVLYIALTRAINELHVLGREKLSLY